MYSYNHNYNKISFYQGGLILVENVLYRDGRCKIFGKWSKVPQHLTDKAFIEAMNAPGLPPDNQLGIGSNNPDTYFVIGKKRFAGTPTVINLLTNGK